MDNKTHLETLGVLVTASNLVADLVASVRTGGEHQSGIPVTDIEHKVVTTIANRLKPQLEFGSANK